MILKLIKKAVIIPIIIYRKCLSPFKLQCCRFYPSCSEYACQAVEKHGVVKGLAKSAWRILRCNPFSSGGYDPV